MSDFFYSPRRRTQEDVTNAFGIISKDATVDLQQYHGEWGTLAVGRSPYRGYAPYEDERHICIVIGGPVLYFRDNTFLGGPASAEGTRSVLERWRDSTMHWDEDLSGPFIVLILDKQSRELVCATDLMLFIPVLICGTGVDLAIASHIDMLAALCGQRHAYDSVSIADFVLHGWVTHPYTAYRAIRQARPASEYRWHEETGLTRSSYWEPEEKNAFANIDEAARYLRNSVAGYIERVTTSMEHVAQFISGGEDSRVLSGALPSRLQRDAYIFLDGMNREGKIAEQIAQVYDADFCPDFRSSSHYLDILPEAAELCGSGFQYRHGHVLGFHERHRLFDYPAVFGGYYSDTLLKGFCAPVSALVRRFDFLPQREQASPADLPPTSHPLFSADILAELTERRRAHWQWVAQVRPASRQEWFFIWPSTMRSSITNVHFNRRLFASFEPFLCKEVIKVSASVPLRWKLNRRLFHRAFQPFLRPSRWHRHADGRFPYLPWWMNCPLHFGTWLFRAIARRLTKDSSNQGSWCDWDAMGRSPEYTAALAVFSGSNQKNEIADLLRNCVARPEQLTAIQKANAMQVFHLLRTAEQFESAVEGEAPANAGVQPEFNV